jgi:hypothetical protein
MSIIKYENFLENPITYQQKEMLEEYYKNYIENNLVKKKEFYKTGLLQSVIYYKELETIDEIFAMYPSVISFEIRERENINNYTKEIERGYYEGEYKLLGVSVINSDGKDIYSATLNKDDETVILKSVTKFYHGIYNFENNVIHYFDYNFDGSLKQMEVKGDLYRASEVINYFGDNWINMLYYHSAEPMIPQ